MPTADRELLLSLYCPARPRTGTPAAYMTLPEAGALLTDRGELGRLVTPEQVAAARTHARTGARPLAGRHPLVVLSPGFTLPRTMFPGRDMRRVSDGRRRRRTCRSSSTG